jgi:hypothetical protein
VSERTMARHGVYGGTNGTKLSAEQQSRLKLLFRSPIG